MDRIARAFAALMPDEAAQNSARARWQKQMHLPAPRAYHNEAHISSVLDSIFEWSDGQPSPVLLAAALYHDVIYDARRKDNETRSAAFCHAELQTGGFGPAETSEAVRLIEATTAHNTQAAQTRDEVLLLDADLLVLSGSPAEYADYVRAVRTEYAHVSDADWQAGRPKVLRRFLERQRIYGGSWDGREAREMRARKNIAGEIASLTGLSSERKNV